MQLTSFLAFAHHKTLYFHCLRQACPLASYGFHPGAYPHGPELCTAPVHFHLGAGTVNVLSLAHDVFDVPEQKLTVAFYTNYVIGAAFPDKGCRFFWQCRASSVNTTS